MYLGFSSICSTIIKKIMLVCQIKAPEYPFHNFCHFKSQKTKLKYISISFRFPSMKIELFKGTLSQYHKFLKWSIKLCNKNLI